MTRTRLPRLDRLLVDLVQGAKRPAAFVLAGHNGSGKSTLWYDRLVIRLQMPLINADRMTSSILPEKDRNGALPAWAQRLRDEDVRWHEISQQGMKAFKQLVMAKQIPFAFETVFSHWVEHSDGRVESKADDILELQDAGYFVVLLFVGLVLPALSIARVQTRRAQGGHAVPTDKPISRYPRTQKAIGYAAPLADTTIFFDNSLKLEDAFSLVRVQQKDSVLFDCRDDAFDVHADLRRVAKMWLPKVCGAWGSNATVTGSERGYP